VLLERTSTPRPRRAQRLCFLECVCFYPGAAIAIAAGRRGAGECGGAPAGMDVRWYSAKHRQGRGAYTPQQRRSAQPQGRYPVPRTSRSAGRAAAKQISLRLQVFGRVHWPLGCSDLARYIYIYTGLVTMDHSIYTECGSVSASAESVWPLDRLWGFGSCGLEFKSSGGLRVFAVFMCRGSPLVLYALLLLLPRKRRMSQTSSCPLMANQHTHLYLPPSVPLISAEPCYFGAAAAGDIGCKNKEASRQLAA
jgi:hypothetical protein